MKMTKSQLQQFVARIRKMFTHDWEAKLVALVLAFLVWYIVKDRVDSAQHPQVQNIKQ